MVKNEVKRSNYGKRSDGFNNFLRSERELYYIPTGNSCFRKLLENVYKSDFSNEYKDFLLDPDRCKNIMTSEKVQPFCKRHGLDIGGFNLNSRRTLPWTLKEKNVCL